MAIVDINYLKSKFEDGDVPNGQDFADLIDTLNNPNPVPLNTLGVGVADNTKYLRGDGVWTAIELNSFTPNSTPPDNTKYLKGDGTWGSSFDISPKSSPPNVTLYLRGDGTWGPVQGSGSITAGQAYIFTFTKQNTITLPLLDDAAYVNVYFDGVYQHDSTYTVDLINKTINFGDLSLFNITEIQVRYIDSKGPQGPPGIPGISTDLSSLFGQENTFLLNQNFTSVTEKKVDLETNSVINLKSGNLFVKTITTATTLSFTNPASSGFVNTFMLELINGGSFPITWWTGIKWSGGTVPALTTTGIDLLGFVSYDSGVSWKGIVLGKDLK